MNTQADFAPSAESIPRRWRRRVPCLTIAVIGLVCLSVTVAQAAVSPPDSGQTTQVSRSTSGSGDANKTSTRARVSQSGDYVVFQSAATNISTVRGGGSHVFLTDLSGSHAVVPTPANHTAMVDVDLAGARCKNAAGANGSSTFNEVSNRVAGDGPWVVFASNCVGLVPGWTHVGDVYIKNMRTGVIDVVSRSNTDDSEPIARVSTRPVISDDGRYVAWNSTDGDVFVRDMRDGSRQRSVRVAASTGGDDESLRPEISGDGTHLIFASDARLAAIDTNTFRDVYLVDLRGWQANRSQTSFTYQAVDLSSTDKLATRASSRPGINRDGSIVSFQTAAPLVPDDSNGVLDAYWRNVATGTTVLISRGHDGAVTSGQSSRPQLDDSGYVVGFVSVSNRMVRGDDNGRPDAFIRSLNSGSPANGTTFMISQTPGGDAGGGAACSATASQDSTLVQAARPGHPGIATRPYLSGDAGRVVFVASMCDLVAPTHPVLTNQILVRDYPAGGPAARSAERAAGQ